MIGWLIGGWLASMAALCGLVGLNRLEDDGPDDDAVWPRP